MNLQEAQCLMLAYKQLPTAEALAAMPRYKQKQIIGGHLFPLVNDIYPRISHKVTDILLDINNNDELLCMIRNPIYLHAKAEQAISVLEAFYVQRASATM